MLRAMFWLAAVVAASLVVPAGVAHHIPILHPCPGQFLDGPSYEPYSAPKGTIRVRIIVASEDAWLTWCFYQGESQLMMSYDGRFTNPGFTWEAQYPAGLYTVRLYTFPGIAQAQASVKLNLTDCVGRSGEIWIKVWHVLPTEAGVDRGGRCLHGNVSDATPTTEPPPVPIFGSPKPKSFVASPASTDAPIGPEKSFGVTAMLGAVASLLVSWYFWSHLKVGLLAFLGRRLGPRAGAHPIRAAFLEIVARSPGIHGNAIRKELGLSEGQFQHHAAILTDQHLVDCFASEGFRHFFPRGRYHVDEMRMLVALRNSTARRLYRHICERPGASIGELADALQVTASGVSKLARRLESVGLVMRSPHTRYPRFTARPVPTGLAAETD